MWQPEDEAVATEDGDEARNARGRNPHVARQVEVEQPERSHVFYRLPIKSINVFVGRSEGRGATLPLAVQLVELRLARQIAAAVRRRAHSPVVDAQVLAARLPRTARRP